MPPIIKAWGEKIEGLSWPLITWGSCRSPPRRRLRLFWKNEWISAFSMEVVRSMDSSERAFSSQRVREKVNATTGVCCRWDRKCRRVSHTARSWWGKKMGGRGMKTWSNRMLLEKNQKAVRRQKRKKRRITWLAEVLWEVFFEPNDWACLLVRSFLASTAA